MPQNTNSKWDNEEIGALWKKVGKAGTFLTGKINGEPVIIFSNKNKKNENQPDYRVYISQSNGGGSAPRQNNNYSRPRQQPRNEPVAANAPNDDIDF